MAKKKKPTSSRRKVRKVVKTTSTEKATEEKEVKGECTDKKCPFHAGLSLRGRGFVGEITRKREKTVRVEWQKHRYFPKYERYAKMTIGVFAHLPECISPKIDIGDEVKIIECRPLSRTKHFVVTGKAKE